MKKQLWKRIAISLVVCFLPMFMALIFGPAEIYFANAREFPFVYREFAGRLALYALFGTGILTLLCVILPNRASTVMLGIITGGSLVAYIQVMFLNKKLDLLGVRPEGYIVNRSTAIVNIIIWIAIIVIAVVVAIWKHQQARMIFGALGGFLLAIQVIAYGSLLLTAKKEAFEYDGTVLHLSGAEQYTVSSKENVIVIILDYCSNTYIDKMEAIYPGATDFLHDFTKFTNVDCHYFGTFPSLSHMFTGQPVDPTLSIDDWCKSIWTNPTTKQFYADLHAKGYKTGFFTDEKDLVLGNNPVELFQDEFDNVSDQPKKLVIDYSRLYKTMIKMSGYRLAPEVLKPVFYTNIDEYGNIVIPQPDDVLKLNAQFYDRMQEWGLSLDKKNNRFIIEHLMGPHLWTTDEYGHDKENSTMEETVKGCMVIVEDYLNRLKNLGVYDNSTIIITADHGDVYNSQVVFFIKRAGESHEISPVNRAEVSLDNLIPTIADAAGIESDKYGQTVYDIPESESRIREYWLRRHDDNYPSVPCFSGLKEGSENTYYIYEYEGDLNDLLEQIELGPVRIVPMTEAFF